MASLQELRKRLRSISTTGQLAGAMKTASSAKLSRVNGLLTKYKEYAAGCQDIMERYAASLSRAMPEGNPEAPAYYVVVSSNRGLCGGYNANLLAYVEAYLADKPASDYRLVVCGRVAQAHFAERGREILRDFQLPDIPDYQSAGALFQFLWEAYTSGQTSRIIFLYPLFRNMLTQTPGEKQLLPLTRGEDASPEETGEPLWIPDRETVMKRLCLAMVRASVYAIALECAAGAQAATLIAMREAYDNARQSAAALELEISRKRQSEVTAGVIETFSGDSENKEG